MKRICFSVISVCFLVIAASVFAGCKSAEVESRPLWTDSYTVGQVFSSENYVTGIGKASGIDSAMSLADGNLASYFSRKISSTTSVQQVMTSEDENGKFEENLIRDISIQSGIEISGIKHTEPWFDKKEGLYYVCSYLDRKEAWRNYEPVVGQAKSNFYSFIDSAEKEEDPFNKIAVLKNAAEAGNTYEDLILFSEILYKKGALPYSQDRNVISSLDERILSVRRGILMDVLVDKDTDRRYIPVVEKVVTSSGYSVSSVGNQYTVFLTLSKNKEVFSDTGTIVSVPEYRVEVKNKNKTLWTYKKSLDRVTGFVEAESFLEKKIAKNVENDLSSGFAEWFQGTVK